MKTNHQTFSRRAMARIFAATWLAMAVSQAGFGAPADISDVPMAVLNSAKPNVMFTLDDSGSMQFEVIPENDDVYLTFPRPYRLYGSDYYGSDWQDASYATHARFTRDNAYARCYRNAQCNPMYYNPATRYRPWSNADGSLMAAASPIAAPYNPNNVAEGTRNLTTNQTDRRQWTNGNNSSTYENVTYYPATYFQYTGSGAAPTAVGAANNTPSQLYAGRDQINDRHLRQRRQTHRLRGFYLHLYGGNPELRQLVHLLPVAYPGGPRGGWSGLFPAAERIDAHRLRGDQQGGDDN